MGGGMVSNADPRLEWHIPPISMHPLFPARFNTSQQSLQQEVKDQTMSS